MDSTLLRQKLHQKIDELPDHALEQVYSVANGYVEPTWREVIDRHLAEETDPKELAVWREESAFLEQHDALKATYLGQHVAMKDGEVVDHDTQIAELYTRMRQKFPNSFVLMKQVEETPDRIIHFRSPRLVQ